MAQLASNRPALELGILWRCAHNTARRRCAELAREGDSLGIVEPLEPRGWASDVKRHHRRVVGEVALAPEGRHSIARGASPWIPE